MCHSPSLGGSDAKAQEILPTCGGVRLQRWSLTGHLSLSLLGLGPIHLSEVRCRGYERTLSDCPSLEGSQNGCQHENDAAVRCNVPNMGFQNQVSSDSGMASGWGRGGWEALREPQDPTSSQWRRGSQRQSGMSSLLGLPWPDPHLTAGFWLSEMSHGDGDSWVDALSHYTLSGPCGAETQGG